MKAVKVYVKATGVVGVDNHYAENSFVSDINGTDECSTWEHGMMWTEMSTRTI